MLISELVFVSNNNHKLTEIRKLMPAGCHLYSMNEAGVTMEIEETGNTFAANAALKANAFFSTTQKNCFADDSGLSVEALNGKPGVFSARFSGPNATDMMNRKKLLKEMEGISKRSAYFITVICTIINNKEYFFEGRVNGVITEEEKGNNGFGYDSIFIPDGYAKTFAEMQPNEKNELSHRAIAVKKMVHFFNSFNN